jgi:hypothetical protein
MQLFDHQPRAAPSRLALTDGGVRSRDRVGRVIATIEAEPEAIHLIGEVVQLGGQIPSGSAQALDLVQESGCLVAGQRPCDRQALSQSDQQVIHRVVHRGGQSSRLPGHQTRPPTRGEPEPERYAAPIKCCVRSPLPSASTR